MKDPRCASCGCLTHYPRGFEIDHIIPLDAGGSEDSSNRQLLCVRWDTDKDGKAAKVGCHADKTALESKTR